MNWRGMYTLFYREVWRFLRVVVQTLMAPALTALLYLVVFSHLLQSRFDLYGGIDYTNFLVPGLMMMSIIQNAFANSSSSIMQSKLMGNLEFVLMAPLSSMEFFLAFVGAALVRGVLVALVIYALAVFLIDIEVVHWWVLILFTVSCSILMGALGLLAGLWAKKIDQLAAFQNFVIMPFSFLSGVFYSIHSLPELWQRLSHFNPFFYMIDGFRYAFIGHSDVDIVWSIMLTLSAMVVISGFCVALLAKGYNLRN